MTEEKTKKATGRKAADPSTKGATKTPGKRPSKVAAADDAAAPADKKPAKAARATAKKPAKAPAERAPKQPGTRAARVAAAGGAGETAVPAASEATATAPAAAAAAQPAAAPVKARRRPAGSTGQPAARLRITQTRSQIGYASKQRRVLAGLGLGRIGRTVTRPDNPAIRGMVAKVQHLVAVEEVEA